MAKKSKKSGGSRPKKAKAEKKPKVAKKPKPPEMSVPAMVAASAPGVHALSMRPPLTAARVDRIVIDNTPKAPPGAVDPDTQLVTLGVVSDELAADLQAGVQSDLNQIGWHIKQDDITSTPSTMVSQCRTSVMKHAF